MAEAERVTEITREVAGASEPFTPLRVHSETMVDWLGEPSFKVTVTLPKAAFRRQELGRWINTTAAGLRRRLVDEGEMRFPYLDVSADRTS